MSSSFFCRFSVLSRSPSPLPFCRFLLKVHQLLQWTFHVLIGQGIYERIETWSDYRVKESGNLSLVFGVTVPWLEVHADDNSIECGPCTEMRPTGAHCFSLPCFGLHSHYSFGSEAIGNKNKGEGFEDSDNTKAKNKNKQTKNDISTFVASTQSILTLVCTLYRKWSRCLFSHVGKFSMIVHNPREVAKLILQITLMILSHRCRFVITK